MYYIIRAAADPRGGGHATRFCTAFSVRARRAPADRGQSHCQIDTTRSKPEANVQPAAQQLQLQLPQPNGG